jgi:hypothetical protein
VSPKYLARVSRRKPPIQEIATLATDTNTIWNRSAEPNPSDSPAYRELFHLLAGDEPWLASPALDHLHKLSEIREVVPLLTARLVIDARESGLTFHEIGDALGITMQSAHQLYARAPAKVRPPDPAKRKL